MTRKYICPSCKEKAGVDIRYGYPSAELIEASERGEVAIGGCCISDNDPERRCLKCEHEWRIEPRKHICPACGEKAGVTLRNGFPSREAEELIRGNEAVFGSYPPLRWDAGRLCLKCGHDWHMKRRS